MRHDPPVLEHAPYLALVAERDVHALRHWRPRSERRVLGGP